MIEIVACPFIRTCLMKESSESQLQMWSQTVVKNEEIDVICQTYWGKTNKQKQKSPGLDSMSLPHLCDSCSPLAFSTLCRRSSTLKDFLRQTKRTGEIRIRAWWMSMSFGWQLKICFQSNISIHDATKGFVNSNADQSWPWIIVMSLGKTQDREHHYHNILLIEVKAKAKHMNYLLAFVLEFRWDMYVSVLCKKMGCKTKQTSNFFKPTQTPLLVSDITERKPLETGASPKYEQPVNSHNENLKPNLTVKCVIWINARCICITCMQKSK